MHSVGLALLSFLLGTNCLAACPAGTTKQTVQSNGGRNEFCVLPDGKRHGSEVGYFQGQLAYEGEWDRGVRSGTWKYYSHRGDLEKSESFLAGHLDGPYAEWAPDGRQTIWGSFKADKEHGVWTMDVGSAEEPRVVFVTFEQGIDLTEKIFENPLPSCQEWQALTDISRAGTLANLCLLAIAKLKGKPASLATNRAEVAACIAVSCSDPSQTRVDCEKTTDFAELLNKRVVSISQKCILEYVQAASEER